MSGWLLGQRLKGSGALSSQGIQCHSADLCLTNALSLKASTLRFLLYALRREQGTWFVNRGSALGEVSLVRVFVVL